MDVLVEIRFKVPLQVNIQSLNFQSNFKVAAK